MSDSPDPTPPLRPIEPSSDKAMKPTQPKIPSFEDLADNTISKPTATPASTHKPLNTPVRPSSSLSSQKAERPSLPKVPPLKPLGSSNVAKVKPSAVPSPPRIREHAEAKSSSPVIPSAQKHPSSITRPKVSTSETQSNTPPRTVVIDPSITIDEDGDETTAGILLVDVLAAAIAIAFAFLFYREVAPYL